MMMEPSIEGLIQERNLEIHFMPIVELSKGEGVPTWRTVAFEALARGPEGHSMRNPYHLFKAAEEAGLREELDLLCVDSALSHRDKLPDGTRLFLNVDPRTFACNHLLSLLERHGPGGSSETPTVVEITEQEVEQGPALRQRVKDIEGIGFDVALDDIGVDAFSFSRLVNSGEVAFWKLDRSVLTQWVGGCEMVKSWLPWLIKAASGLGVKLIIEGLEGHHLEMIPGLRGLGIGFGQGYLFGKPAILSPGVGSWRRGFQEAIPAAGFDRSPQRLVPIALKGGVAELLRTLHPAL